MKLNSHLVEKPWGVTKLPAIYGETSGRRIGEVWLNNSLGDLPLLAKYIFTSERLSIQNHPSDEQARMRGHPSGKEECWFVLDAQPGGMLGLGLKVAIDKDALRAAALDGSIEDLIDWRPVKPGDFFYVPAGTVHAIGAGVSLLELQQNADITYRLFDYGRARPLHLNEGIAVADPRPYADPRARSVALDEQVVLVDGPLFSLVQSVGDDPLRDRQRWVMPIDCAVRSGRDRAEPGECLLLAPADELELGAGRVLIAAWGSLSPARRTMRMRAAA